jgi:uncharacterized protein (DUF2147 family)
VVPAPLLIAILAAQQPPIDGYWRNPIGSAIIRIAPCGDSLCGKVVWASERGKREAATSSSNIVGTTVLTAVNRSDAGWAGKLFIPDDNIHVSARLQLLGQDRLKLTGCAFAGLICRSQIWTRTVEPLPGSD